MTALDNSARRLSDAELDPIAARLAREIAEELATADGESPVSQQDPSRQALTHKLLVARLDHLSREFMSQGRDLSEADEDELTSRIRSHLFGEGELDRLVQDDSIENVFANAWDDVWVRRADGTTEQIPPITASEEALNELIRQTAARDGRSERRFDRGQPSVSFRLAGGSLNWAAGRDVAAVIVEPGAQLEQPVHLVHIAAPGEDTTASHPRAVVLVGPGSRVHLIESYVGLPGSSITNASTRIVAGADSTVTHHRIQDEAARAIHVGRTAIEQGTGSTVRATSIMTGSRIARGAIDIRFMGTDARADIDGLYLPRGDQRHDNVITVDHRASHCTSTQRFKGIVDDHGRGSFSGHVLVRHGTTGTDAHQSNRNLVLTPAAQADTRPWLEILADDVRCTHGATVGRLDDEALFYLRSRGIPLEQSRAMLVAAFAAEVIDTINPASLRDRVVATFAALRDAG